MKIKRIAITGNIGSGKSIVCKIFNHLGINTFHSDEETKKLYLLPDVKKEIVSVASLVAQKVVSVSIDAETQDALIDETLKEMGDSTWLS